MAHLELIMMIGGICIMVASTYVLPGAINATQRAATSFVPMDGLLGWRFDLYWGCVWSGLLLVQVANILGHVRPDGTFQLSSLTLAATAAVLLLCGICAGRLLLRAELRRYEGRRDEPDRAASP